VLSQWLKSRCAQTVVQWFASFLVLFGQPREAMPFHLLEAEQTAVLVLASCILLDDVLALAFASTSCRALARLGLRRLRLQSVASVKPATALHRLVSSSLTDRGAGLVELDASFCRCIDNDALKSLPQLPSLQRLILDGCQDIDDEGLQALAQRCSGLRHLSLYWNVKATDAGFGKLLRAQKGANFHTVSFSGCKNLGNETVQRLVGRGPNMEILDLTRCPRVSDSGALLVCECLDRLRVLRLYAMAQLSPAAFANLKRLVRLEELDLCGCRVQDGALTDFFAAAAPTKLHTLNITWCPELTDAAVLAVASSCPALGWLSLFGNMNFTKAAVEALAAGSCGPVLHSLDVRGLTKAVPYSLDPEALRKLFPALVSVELHH